MKTINVVINDNEKPLLKQIDDEEKLFFKSSGITISPVRIDTIAPLADTDV